MIGTVLKTLPFLLITSSAFSKSHPHLVSCFSHRESIDFVGNEQEQAEKEDAS